MLRALVLAVALQPATLTAVAAEPAAPNSPLARDGSHDFDFNFGTWNTHIIRVLNPLEGGTDSAEMNGTVTVRKIWGGRAQLEEIKADGPKSHMEGLTLFLYNPSAHQWSQIFTNSRVAMMGTPAIGGFKNGRGELFESTTFEGRAILVRAVWSNITPDAHHFEEDYSTDGGATWSPAFIADLTRRAP
jgi:hypothetical protein